MGKITADFLYLLHNNILFLFYLNKYVTKYGIISHRKFLQKIMNQFATHTQRLKDLIQHQRHLDKTDLAEAVDLDSIDSVMRSYLSISQMKDAGSFFTGQKLATAAVNQLGAPITFSSKVLDPTCGAGNLLIECSRKLGIEGTLSETLEKWGKVLHGFDLHKSFIDAAKVRIALEALSRGCRLDCSLETAVLYLPNIQVADAMEISPAELSCISHLVMNPPFIYWPSPSIGFWKKGKVNAAGIVTAHYLQFAPDNCSISAILPDVLRSGSRYQEFRDFIERRMTAAKCHLWGRFNRKTDIDVFLLSGYIGTDSYPTLWKEKNAGNTVLSDYFNVLTGPLVSYRDPEQGMEYPYIHAKNARSGVELNEIHETRFFTGRVIEPPFVVIKRTSSPSDKMRAKATLINVSASEVAVENHLIVAQPKSKKLQDCRRLMKVLASNKTNHFLNQRIRTRHLTCSAVKEIPIDSFFPPVGWS